MGSGATPCAIARSEKILTATSMSARKYLTAFPLTKVLIEVTAPPCLRQKEARFVSFTVSSSLIAIAHLPTLPPARVVSHSCPLFNLRHSGFHSNDVPFLRIHQKQISRNYKNAKYC
jgi:hypothetical protein